MLLLTDTIEKGTQRLDSVGFALDQEHILEGEEVFKITKGDS